MTYIDIYYNEISQYVILVRQRGSSGTFYESRLQRCRQAVEQCVLRAGTQSRHCAVWWRAPACSNAQTLRQN